MNLFITEKPSVAQMFATALRATNRGNGYIEGNGNIVTWCVGHLIGMSYPEAYGEEFKEWKMETLPFIPGQFKYEVISSVKDQFEVVREQMLRDDVDTIYYSGDSAREGEYIQRLVRMVVKPTGKEERRVWIDSQTEEEILRGIREAKLLSEYDSLSDAAYMRAAEDYLFGINLSRAYSVKFGSLFNSLAKTGKHEAFAVGRVMTCALGMIVERERLIRSAKEIPFYGVKATTGNGISADWKPDEHSKYHESPLLFKPGAFREKQFAEQFIEEQKPGTFKLIAKNITTETQSAPLLYNLAELQNDCSQQLKISPDKTLEVVQSLYEKKLVTYPRTDARVLTTAICKEISRNLYGLRNNLAFKDVVEDILSDNPENIANTRYTNDKMVSDHYAIIPTGLAPNSLSPLENSVYSLITKRFVAIFMPPAVSRKISCTFVNGEEKYVCTEKEMTEEGFLTLYDKHAEKNPEFTKLNELDEGKAYEVIYSIAEGKTSPPKRYTSGSMILAMENAGQLIEDAELRAQIKGSGIGTSATRADTLKKLVNNGYISLNAKTQVLTPNKCGEAMYDIVKNVTPSLLKPEMTANWEKGLSMVESKEIDKDAYFEKLKAYITREVNAVKTVDPQSIYALFPGVSFSLENRSYTKPNVRKFVKKAPNNTLPAICPHCGNAMRKINAKTGELWAYGCSRCMALIPFKVAGLQLTEEQMAQLLYTGKTDKIDGFTSRTGGTFSASLKIDKEWKVVFEFEQKQNKKQEQKNYHNNNEGLKDIFN